MLLYIHSHHKQQIVFHQQKRITYMVAVVNDSADLSKCPTKYTLCIQLYTIIKVGYFAGLDIHFYN